MGHLPRRLHAVLVLIVLLCVNVIPGWCDVPGSVTLAKYQLGFEDEFECGAAAVYDEPQRIRMRCTRVPPRSMDCGCTSTGILGVRLTCTCDAVKNATGHVVPLLPRHTTPTP